MRGNEHLAIAVVTAGGAIFLLNHGHMDVSAPALAAVAAAGIGSLVPDIDHPKAWISDRIPATLLGLSAMVLVTYWIMRWSSARSGPMSLGAATSAPLAAMMAPLLGWAWLTIALGIVLLVVGMLIASLVEHRGPTHSLTVGAGLSLSACVGFAIAGQPFTLGLWFGWGYLSHLLADMTTKMGCPSLLWPWREGDLATLKKVTPAYQPMTRPGVQESGTPSQSTSAYANGDGGLTQPVEDLQSYVATGFAQDVLAPSDLPASEQQGR